MAKPGKWARQMAISSTSFTKTLRPSHNGRTSTAWMRERLNKATRLGDATGDTTLREAIFDHLVEIATSYEVKVIGRDRDGELLKVANTQPAVEAAKLILAYDMGGAPKGVNEVEVADHLRAVAKQQIDMALGILGNRIYSIDPNELRRFFSECSEDPAKFIEKARALVDGDTSAPPVALPEAKPEP